MDKKYGGQGHHQLGQGVTQNYQDQPIGGALGDAMGNKYGNAGGGVNLPLFNKQDVAGTGNGYSEPAAAATNNFY